MGTRLLFAGWSGLAAVLLLTGGHRWFYALASPLPDLAASLLAGLANLSWYELAYVIGSAAKRPLVFAAVPYVGIATAFLPSVALVLPGTTWFRRAALAHVAAGLVVGGLALAVLVSRTARGFPDPWRLVTTLALVATHAGWAGYLVRRRRLPAAAPAIALEP